MERPLGLIAGEGDLPRLIAEDRDRRGLDTLVVRFEGARADWAESHEVVDLPFEKPGRMFRALERKGCDRVCFAGAMVRPRLDPLRFDLKALTLAGKVPALLKKGDDAMLRGLAAIFEGEGYAVVAPHDQLRGLLAPEGVMSRRRPTESDEVDAARAAGIAAVLGTVDVGQGAVVAGGLCLGVEAVAGTDALLAQVAALPERYRQGEARGILWKGPKPGQDWRMDLPAVGPETMRQAGAARLGGVCLASDAVLVLGMEDTIRAADEAGLALWARPAPR